VRVFVCDQEVITKCSILYLEEVGDYSLGELMGSSCVILAGTSERLAGPKVFEGAHCRRCGTG